MNSQPSTRSKTRSFWLAKKPSATSFASAIDRAFRKRRFWHIAEIARNLRQSKRIPEGFANGKDNLRFTQLTAGNRQLLKTRLRAHVNFTVLVATHVRFRGRCPAIAPRLRTFRTALLTTARPCCCRSQPGGY